jgi:drug/metabolite transporter (DMT)-like permease
MTFAYRAERAPTVAAATYAAPAFGIAIDGVVFAVYPTPLALLGGVIVVGAGLVLVLRRVEGSSDARDV